MDLMHTANILTQTVLVSAETSTDRNRTCSVIHIDPSLFSIGCRVTNEAVLQTFSSMKLNGQTESTCKVPIFRVIGQ